MRLLKLPPFIIILLLFGFSGALLAKEQTVRLNAASGAKADYVINLLQLAFSHVDTRYRIKKDLTASTQSRISEEVQAGNLDLMWVSTRQSYEEDFLPIRIPLLKGLLGYRILLIRANEQKNSIPFLPKRI